MGTKGHFYITLLLVAVPVLNLHVYFIM